MQKHQIVNAWDIITAVIHKTDLPIKVKFEAKEAADFLRLAAEKALPKSALTATEIDERAQVRLGGNASTLGGN